MGVRVCNAGFDVASGWFAFRVLGAKLNFGSGFDGWSGFVV